MILYDVNLITFNTSPLNLGIPKLYIILNIK